MKKKDLTPRSRSISFLETLSTTAKRANAGTAMVSFSKMEDFEGASMFVIYVAKDSCRFDAVKTFVDALEKEEEEG